MRAADGIRRLARLRGPIACLVLTACGGGGGDGGNGTIERPPTASPGGIAEPLRGTVVFRTEGDKTTVDGWFVPRADAEPDADGVDDCTLADALAPSRVRTDVAATPATTRFPGGRYVGDALPMTSREGDYAVLQAQRLGDVAVYATPERWLRGELPDDLMLEIPGSEAFPGLAAVPVPPLEPLVVSAPADGVLSSGDQAIEWEPSGDADDHVVLELSAADVDGSSDALASIRCRLLDDGHFVLPGTLRAELPAGANGVHVTLIRERRVDVGHDAASLSLIQQNLP